MQFILVFFLKIAFSLFKTYIRFHFTCIIDINDTQHQQQFMESITKSKQRKAKVLPITLRRENDIPLVVMKP